jgi:TetR/AcrR family transcriptional regulator, hemagglutinin/protease regulatory protein
MEKVLEHVRKRAGRLPPEVRQRRLLACAVREFARTGIGSAVHADIAREAGVSVPTVFQYFPSREILITSVLAEVERFLLQIIEQAVAARIASTEKIRTILLAFAVAVDAYPDYIKIWLNWSTIIAAPTWPHYVAFQDKVLAKLEALIEEGKAAGEIPREIDAAIGAHLIMGSGHMIAQMKFRDRDDAMVETFVRSLIERGFH